MTTLRSFQADIDNIRANEVSKQRKHAIAQIDQENVKGKGKEKENGEKPAAVNVLDHYDLVNEDAEASIQVSDLCTAALGQANPHGPSHFY